MKLLLTITLIAGLMFTGCTKEEIPTVCRTVEGRKIENKYCYFKLNGEWEKVSAFYYIKYDIGAEFCY